jgi:hypothetical protein
MNEGRDERPILPRGRERGRLPRAGFAGVVSRAAEVVVVLVGAEVRAGARAGTEAGAGAGAGAGALVANGAELTAG